MIYLVLIFTAIISAYLGFRFCEQRWANMSDEAFFYCLTRILDYRDSKGLSAVKYFEINEDDKEL